MAIEHDLLNQNNPTNAGVDSVEQAQKISSMSTNIMKQVEDNLAEESEIQDVRADQISSMSKILKNMTKASVSLADGSKRLTIETTKSIGRLSLSGAKAIKDSAGEYSKAISQDININRQNLMMTSMSTISPIAGYFAARILDTGVFKSAIGKMKESMGQAFSSVGSKFASVAAAGFGKFKGMFGGKEGVVEKPTKKIGPKPTVSEEELRQIKESLPQAAEGGYVAKEGMVTVHAGEVIQPVDKVVDEVMNQVNEQSKLTLQNQTKMQSSFFATMTKAMHVSSSSSLRRMASMESDMNQQRRGIFKSFIRGVKIATNPDGMYGIQERQLRALVEIKSSFADEMGVMKIAWETTLLEHPGLKATMDFASGMGKTFLGILKYPFKIRGGKYTRLLSSTGNVFEDIKVISGHHMVITAVRLDAIAKNTYETTTGINKMVEHFTGKKTKQDKMSMKEKGRFRVIGKDYRYIKSFMGLMAKPFQMLDDKLSGKGKKTPELEFMSTEVKLLTGLKNIQYEMLSLHKGEFISKYDLMINKHSKSNKQLLLAETNSENISKTLKENAKVIKTGLKIQNKQNSIVNLMNKKRNRIAEKAIRIARAARRKLGGKIISIMMVVMGFLGKAKSLLMGLPGIGKGISLVAKLLGPTGKLVASLGKTLYKTLGPLIGSVAKKAMSIAPSLLAKGGPLIAAGAIGYGIGTIINKTIVGPLMNKAYAHMDAIAAKRNKAESDRLKGMSDQFKTGSSVTERASAKAVIKHKAQMGSTMKRGTKIQSMWGSLDGDEAERIKSAQSAYMQDNISTYMKFDPDKLARYRQAWASGSGTTIDWTGNPESYGKAREKAFHTWLKNKSKNTEAMSEADLAKAYKITGIEPSEPGLVVAKQKMAALQIASVKKTKEVMEDLGKIVDKMGNDVTAAQAQAGNVVSSSMSQINNNMSNVTNAINETAKQGMDRLSQPEVRDVANGTDIS